MLRAIAWVSCLRQRLASTVGVSASVCRTHLSLRCCLLYRGLLATSPDPRGLESGSVSGRVRPECGMDLLFSRLSCIPQISRSPRAGTVLSPPLCPCAVPGLLEPQPTLSRGPAQNSRITTGILGQNWCQHFGAGRFFATKGHLDIDNIICRPHKSSI